MTTTKSLLSFAGIGVFTLATLSAEPVMLKLKWESGKAYIYKNATNMDMKMAMPGAEAPVEMTTEMTQTYRQTVSDHEKGKKVAMSFDSIIMDTQMGGQSMMKFDSTDEESMKGPAAEAMKGMLDIKIDTIFDNDGKLLAVENFKGGEGAAAAMMNESTLKQMVEATNKMLPDKPVSPGDTWTSNVDVEMPQIGKMTTTMNLKLVSVSGGMANITYTGDIKMAGGAGVEMKAEKMEGTVEFDVEKGVLKKSTAIVNLKMKAPAAAAAANAQEIPVDTTTTQELVEVVDAK